MIFFHIIDDYCLQQSWLAFGKQKSFWEEKAPDDLYRHDYICALIVHGISWSFMIMLPIAFACKFNMSLMFLIVFIVNAIIHATVDHLKANKKILNLIQDQLIHLYQIVVTFLIMVVEL